MFKYFFTLLILVVNLYGEKSIEQVERELAFQELEIEVERLKDKAKSGDTEAELELQAKESELKLAKQRLESSSSDNLELKAKELELKERELQLRERELELKQKEAELKESEKPVERVRTKKVVNSNKFKRARERAVKRKRSYIAIRHGSGSSEIEIDYDDYYSYTYTAEDVDSSATEILYGFITPNYNRGEFGLFTSSLGDGETPITGSGFGYRHIFTGKYVDSDNMYLYFSYSLHYMGVSDFIYDGDAGVLGVTFGLGGIVEIGDSMELYIGYEAGSLAYIGEENDYGESVTIAESRGLTKVGLAIKF